MIDERPPPRPAPVAGIPMGCPVDEAALAIETAYASPTGRTTIGHVVCTCCGRRYTVTVTLTDSPGR